MIVTFDIIKTNAEKMFVGGDSSGAHAAMFSQIIQDEDNMDADVN